MPSSPPIPPFLTGNSGQAARSIGHALREPFLHWPDEILTREAVEFTTPRRRYAVVSSPDLIQKILSNRDGCFPRARAHDRILGSTFGENLVRGEQSEWNQRRREIARPITPSRASKALPAMIDSCDDLIESWRKAGEAHAPDLDVDLRRLSLVALWNAFFGAGGDANTITTEIERTVRQIADLSYLEHASEIDLLRPLAKQALRSGFSASSKLGPSGTLDVNTMALFLDAGYGNVAAALHAALWLLADRPDLQDAIRDETFADGKIDLAAMPVTEAVILETLRLMPPVTQMVRDVECDLFADGRTIERGFTAIVSIYGLHRHRNYWTDPDLFLPERYLDAEKTKSLRALMLPFGTGPRGCIGANFARLELAVFLSRIIQSFELRPNPAADITVSTAWALRLETSDPVLVTAIDR